MVKRGNPGRGWTVALLTLLAAGQGRAGSVGTALTVQIRVEGACELYARQEGVVTLRCTRNYTPADPHALKDLSGVLPAGPLVLAASGPAPGGGTLNEYRVLAGDSADHPAVRFTESP